MIKSKPISSVLFNRADTEKNHFSAFRLIQSSNGEDLNMKIKITILSAIAAAAFGIASIAQAETLRLLTWGSYAPEELIQKFEQEKSRHHGRSHIFQQ